MERLRRVERENLAVPIEQKPAWIKTTAHTGPNYSDVKSLVAGTDLHTVCQSAGCPNVYECWEDREATFLVGGSVCTRRCDFCLIDTGRPGVFDTSEPARVAASVAHLGLRYATVTGVARDDLPDGGAWIYAETARRIHALPWFDGERVGVELLVPDFRDDDDALNQVFDSAPEVFGHNVETVPRLFRRIRPAFSYERSLGVLGKAKAAGLVPKSNLMLGMGETTDEIVQTMAELVAVGCELLTITQYLRPSPTHHPVERWVKPEEFADLRDLALEMGFLAVLSGPLVRSSYRAGRLWREAQAR
ncbi:MAG: lipoyl synthase [Promicromonosporaceae bacterium]|nr:lipoyl synthase [Promicromonosporaceae bacterium]